MNRRGCCGECVATTHPVREACREGWREPQLYRVSTTSGRAPRFDACVVNKPDKPHEHASSMKRERKREEKWRRERRKASKGTFCNRLLSLPLFPFFVSLHPPAMDSDYPHWILYPRASPSRGYLCTLRYINKSWKFIYRIIATR